MFKIWGIIFFFLPLMGIGYTFWRTWCILPLPNLYKTIVLAVMGLCIFLFFGNFVLFNTDHWPMPLATATYVIGNSSLIILLYAVLLFLLLDIGRLIHLIPRDFMNNSWMGTLSIATLLTLTFTLGYLNYKHKVKRPLDLATTKTIGQRKTIVMMSDMHIGYHNQRKELARWIDLVNAENPDLILISGDIIDGRFRPIAEQDMAQEFRRLKAPVVACLGNHEYYAGDKLSADFYRDAGIILLRDKAITLKGINLIGRDDRSNHNRKPLTQLTEGLDTTLYTILIDHQPYHLEEAQQAGIDFQLSGHTHDGQLCPINWIVRSIYEKGYGELFKGKTQYYITSGMGIWGAKFRIGTQSEYVVGRLYTKSDNQ